MSPSLFRNNSTVTCVQRAQGIDRYGSEGRGIVSGFTDFRIYIERTSSRTSDVNGVTTTVDGTAMVAKRFKLEEGDLLEMEDGSKWIIFNELEALDIRGSVVHRIYGLTKQRKNN